MILFQSQLTAVKTADRVVSISFAAEAYPKTQLKLKCAGDSNPPGGPKGEMDRALKRQQISKRRQAQHLRYCAAAAGSASPRTRRNLQGISFLFSADSSIYGLPQHPLGPSEQDMQCNVFIVPLVLLGLRREAAESWSTR